MNNSINMNQSDTHSIIELIIAEQAGSLSVEALQELESWAAQSAERQAFLARCRNQQLTEEALEEMSRIDEKAALDRFKNKYAGELFLVHRMPQKRYKRWLVAAAVLGLALTGGWWFLMRDSKPATPQTTAAQPVPSILPATGQKATLTLSDGKVISLDDSKDGMLAQDAGARVNKKGDALVYHADKSSQQKNTSQPVAYNTVSTPKGGFYKLSLPDQSFVWLNAESSIRFPTAFAGKERRVAVTGEAYFEVMKKADQPFIVSINDGASEVRVLGTHFNISAYKDLSAITTTLLQGRVEVASGHKEAVISPGQQAVITGIAASTPKIEVAAANTEEAVAWKNGYFSFQGATVQEIMRETKRWYDIDVEYQSQIPGNFIAYLPRNLPLNSLLKILEATDKVKFSIDGKKVTVTQP